MAASLEVFSPFTLFVFGSNALSFIMYWLLGSFFLLADLKYFDIHAFKMQPKKKLIEDSGRLSKAVWVVLRNQLVGFLLSVLMYYPAVVWRGMSMKAADLPTPLEALAHFAIYQVVEETMFYYSHRLLHTPRFYYLHKQHHEWTSPISITATYCSVVEHLMSNLLPVMAGPFICGSHMLLMYAWIMLAISVTLHSHAGFHFPFLSLSPEYHDYHHLKYDCNYGVLGVLDWFHGTNGDFFIDKQGDEHRTYWSIAEALGRSKRVFSTLEETQTTILSAISEKND